MRYERLRSSPVAVRMTRYTVGSCVALATSVAVFALLYDLGVGTTIDSVIAFLAGAVPNWVLNRRWAWQVRGRISVGREVIGYVAISVLALIASSVATGLTQSAVRGLGHDVRVVLVTISYVAVQAILFAAKFVAYDRWVFARRNPARRGLRSRRQVWIAARANRTP